ncbi:MAG: nif-specific transcriptional activator NifA [Omnitrophica bacterium RIFCSPLOWO2_12_FULL_44_17]|uniref:Nif-specific regulatory protein n=1 Tax=Candidatus Danuiimicrobium aquiferis TaxID=1801832 RepID=A0A1G1KSI9_9BACT|nr:MAG: nif-specific transcriptional activator NifA [Omnitrophica bacterium RIFCSPHIGHO2_02_FULL_45_28]OGW90122.1 MAG: nif-specific transcriptional activator NifA [Omnitrophica bacterium RIFCSPHIGHO2_12_FULL_44_12]OGW95896.1 MAG: nif-specific transcriptional activator NifA [Omnitrophica bacterium RIFCSPLOWO2_12_FULL_44_17]OGX01895.1 MAG: nif-specific transcriptional activator NifA [Omnitrophica bacterium RIFCSPLOWO2_02_FULL_44_11]
MKQEAVGSENIKLTALTEILQAISSTLDLKTVMKKILPVLHEHLGMHRGTLTLLNPETNELSIQEAYGLENAEIKRGKYKLGEGVTGKVVATGEPLVVPNIGEEPLFLNRTQARDALTKSKISFICVPIKLEGKTVGALSVDLLFQEGTGFDEDVKFLTIISNYIAQAVKVNKLVRKDREDLTFENLRLKNELKERYRPVNIIGTSKRMIDVYSSIDLVSMSKANVLIRGESGTGKELVAHAIHYRSSRAENPFVKVSCAALPETLLESEIFGYEKGAFTGATALKKGKFEIAHTGTIFLDEIGDISPATQVKLLRVLQEKEFERVGGLEVIRADIRFVAATNKDLEKEVREGRFREDLYYRLNVIPIFLPPLRDRKEDLPLLVQHFIDKANKSNNKQIKKVSDDAWEYIMNYTWPGNVRELENAIERATVMCQGETIEREHFPLDLRANIRPAGEDELENGDIQNLPKAVERLERRLLVNALNQTKGNKRKASQLLGVTERMLGYKVKQYGLA